MRRDDWSHSINDSCPSRDELSTGAKPDPLLSLSRRCIHVTSVALGITLAVARVPPILRHTHQDAHHMDDQDVHRLDDSRDLV